MVLPVGCRALMNRQLFLLLVLRECEASAELGPTPSSVLRHNILEEFSEVLLFLVLMIPRLESCGPALRAKFLTHLDRHFDYEATLEERRRGITGPPLYANPLDSVRRGGLLPDYWRRTSRHVAVLESLVKDTLLRLQEAGTLMVSAIKDSRAVEVLVAHIQPSLLSEVRDAVLPIQWMERLLGFLDAPDVYSTALTHLALRRACSSSILLFIYRFSVDTKWLLEGRLEQLQHLLCMVSDHEEGHPGLVLSPMQLLLPGLGVVPRVRCWSRYRGGLVSSPGWTLDDDALHEHVEQLLLACRCEWT